ncbi:TPA: hypothetical protein U0K67_000205 [Streptococcus suis]|nr:hypothetical protein [Streptococcus suis]
MNKETQTVEAVENDKRATAEPEQVVKKYNKVHVNLRTYSQKSSRQATQSDFDSF